MKSTYEIDQGNFYLFESLSSAHSSFFDTSREVQIFKSLLNRYLSKYIEIHRVFIDVNGYQILVRVKQFRTIKANYIKGCNKKRKEVRLDFLKKPWKIISEMMRIFKSVYVKTINRMRGREGVLVKHKYRKYYFEGVAEYELYVKRMEKGKRIRSQRNKLYEKSFGGKKTEKWLKFRARVWSEVVGFKGFQDLVRRELIKNTFSHHTPSKNFTRSDHF